MSSTLICPPRPRETFFQPCKKKKKKTFFGRKKKEKKKTDIATVERFEPVGMRGSKQTFDRAVHAPRRGTFRSRILFEMLKQSTVWCGELLFTQFCPKMCFTHEYLVDKMNNNGTETQKNIYIYG